MIRSSELIRSPEVRRTRGRPFVRSCASTEVRVTKTKAVRASLLPAAVPGERGPPVTPDPESREGPGHSAARHTSAARRKSQVRQRNPAEVRAGNLVAWKGSTRGDGAPAWADEVDPAERFASLCSDAGSGPEGGSGKAEAEALREFPGHAVTPPARELRYAHLPASGQ